MPEIVNQPAQLLAPHSENAEELLLGSILLQPELFEEVRAIVTANDFYILRNAWVFAAMEALYAEGMDIDNATTNYKLNVQGHADYGGPSYLTWVMAEAVTAQYWHSYANIVRNAAIRRRLLEYANNTALLARDEDMDTYRVLGQTELALEKLTSVTLPAGATPAQRDAADLVDEIDLFQRGEKINRLKTGFPSLDNILVGKGLSKSTFTLVSADTSGGKSLFMINVAVNLILSGVPVYWHTVEMSKQDLLIRILARLSGIPEERLKEPGGIKPSEQASYDTAVSKFIAEVSPLLILDSEVKHATLSYSVSAIKRAVREHGIQVAFIDYPGIFDDRELEAVGDRQERLGYMTRRYLQLAQTLEIPIWAAAQQARDDRGDRTGVKGVGESYKTVQHASCFILLRNEDSTDEYSTLKTKIVSVSKQRNGRRGKFTIQADEGTQYCYESTTEPTFDNFSPFD